MTAENYRLITTEIHIMLTASNNILSLLKIDDLAKKNFQLNSEPLNFGPLSLGKAGKTYMLWNQTFIKEFEIKNAKNDDDCFHKAKKKAYQITVEYCLEHGIAPPPKPI